MCAFCKSTLIAELQKGYTYYRCQAKPCQQKTIREEIVENAYTGTLKLLQFDCCEMEYFDQHIGDDERIESQRLEEHEKALKLQVEQVKGRLSKLTDAYLDGALNRELFVGKKNDLLAEEQSLKEKLANVEDDGSRVVNQIREIIERANCSYQSYKEGDFNEKRGLVKSTTSNFLVEQKNVSVKLYLPFHLVAERQRETCGSPHRDVPRTLSPLLSALYDYVAKTRGVMPFDAQSDERSFLSRAA